MRRLPYASDNRGINTPKTGEAWASSPIWHRLTQRHLLSVCRTNRITHWIDPPAIPGEQSFPEEITEPQLRLRCVPGECVSSTSNETPNFHNNTPPPGVNLMRTIGGSPPKEGDQPQNPSSACGASRESVFSTRNKTSDPVINTPHLWWGPLDEALYGKGTHLRPPNPPEVRPGTKVQPARGMQPSFKWFQTKAS